VKGGEGGDKSTRDPSSLDLGSRWWCQLAGSLDLPCLVEETTFSASFVSTWSQAASCRRLKRMRHSKAREARSIDHRQGQAQRSQRLKVGAGAAVVTSAWTLVRYLPSAPAPRAPKCWQPAPRSTVHATFSSSQMDRGPWTVDRGPFLHELLSTTRGACTQPSRYRSSMSG
jgi:hypothetical protein